MLCAIGPRTSTNFVTFLIWIFTLSLAELTSEVAAVLVVRTFGGDGYRRGVGFAFWATADAANNVMIAIVTAANLIIVMSNSFLLKNLEKFYHIKDA
jgi:hypothetical protein